MFAINILAAILNEQLWLLLLLWLLMLVSEKGCVLNNTGVWPGVAEQLFGHGTFDFVSKCYVCEHDMPTRTHALTHMHSFGCS